MFYRNNNPQSFRRPFYLPPKKEVITAPPPGGSSDYIGWEFENNLIDTENNLTFTNISTVSLSYPVAVVGNGVQWTGVSASANQDILHLVDPGSDFMADWSVPWAISFWQKRSASTTAVSFNLKVNNTSLAVNTGLLWSAATFGNNVYWSYNDSNYTSDNESFSLSNNSWDFVYWRYDPSENKKVYMGVNAQAEKSITYTTEHDSTTYNSAYTLTIGQGDTGKIMALDQLVFWHTTAKTRQNMLDLYNSGSGLPL